MEQGSFTDGASTVALPIALANGNYTFYLETGDYAVTYGGINLFFNNSAAPGISVYGLATNDKTVFPAFLVGTTSTQTASLSNTYVNGSGSSSFSSGGTTVALTGMQWVSSGADAYSNSKAVVRVDLSVGDTSAAPEPASLVMSGAALLALGLIRRKRA